MTQVHLELASEARWDPPGSQVGVAGLQSGVGEGPGPRVSDAKSTHARMDTAKVTGLRGGPGGTWKQCDGEARGDQTQEKQDVRS